MKYINSPLHLQNAPTRSKIKIQNIDINFVIDNSVRDDTYKFREKEYSISGTWIPALRYSIARGELHAESQPVYLSIDSYLGFKEAMYEHFMEIEETHGD